MAASCPLLPAAPPARKSAALLKSLETGATLSAR
jgi:hypothetical protein